MDAPAPAPAQPTVAAPVADDDAQLRRALDALAGDEGAADGGAPEVPAATDTSVAELLGPVAELGLTLLVEWQAPTMPAAKVAELARVRPAEERLLAKVGERIPALRHLPTGPLVLLTCIVIAMPRLAVARRFRALAQAQEPPRPPAAPSSSTKPTRPRTAGELPVARPVRRGGS